MNYSLPYKVEYSVGVQNCKKCTKKIRSGVLKIAIMMQSEEDDCQYPDWYHQKCFFKTHLPKTEAAFDGFAKLRYSDQLGIKERMGTVEKVVVKHVAKKVKMESPRVSDFSIETTKKVRRSCDGCMQKFAIPDIRIKYVACKTDLTVESNSLSGQTAWYHVICFASSRSELGWSESGDNLPGFNRLSDMNKVLVKRYIPVIRRNCNAFVHKTTDEERNELEKLIENQNREYYDLYDKITQNLSKKVQSEILRMNFQFIPDTKSQITHHLTDILYFGALESCVKCYGSYYFNNSIYSCSKLNRWGRCANDVRVPKRTIAYVRHLWELAYPFLSNKRRTLRTRALHQFRLKDENGQDLIEMPYEKPALFNMEFVVIGRLKMPMQEIESTIKKMGGKVVMAIHDKLAAVISNEEEISKMGAKMTLAKRHSIQVVSELFLSSIESTDPYMCIFRHCLSDWGGNPHVRIEQEEDVKSRRETIFYTKTIPEKITYNLNGTDYENDLVDIESGVKGSAHVYSGEFNGKQIKYMVVLVLVDIEMNKNSYHRMQLLESNDCTKYWLFESWGRISTMIGSKRLTNCVSADDACTKFESVFMEKNGNEFGTFSFYKNEGKYYHLNVDFEIIKRIPKTFIESKLDRPIYDLMKMIFDTKHMKNMMLSCDLDLRQMPLGQISSIQIHEAMSVLKTIEKIITENGTPVQLRNASNEFYTLIPHGFSIKRPTVIDSIDVVKVKMEMLEGLMNMKTISSFTQEENGEKLNPMDACYKNITTEINLLDKNAPEFVEICKIVRNTHGATHNQYTLEVVEVFKIKRKREDIRCRKYKELDHQMLWHGSKSINFVSILSKGLRIAPKEAPSTGYMFGKGIYFADMVSKSANYCNPTKKTGLLLLCDVAIGKSTTATYAHNFKEIPNENEQSVKALGAVYPTEYSTLDGIKVASGKLRRANFSTGLHYNEYVVYDIAQVKMKYLVRVKFNFKSK